jgi:hypothetical protein
MYVWTYPEGDSNLRAVLGASHRCSSRSHSSSTVFKRPQGSQWNVQSKFKPRFCLRRFESRSACTAQGHRLTEFWLRTVMSTLCRHFYYQTPSRHKTILTPNILWIIHCCGLIIFAHLVQTFWMSRSWDWQGAIFQEKYFLVWEVPVVCTFTITQMLCVRN